MTPTINIPQAEPVESESNDIDVAGDEQSPATAGIYTVKDEASANWLVRKILSARAYAQRVATWAEEEKRRAQREEEFFMRCYGRQLEDWAAGEIARRGGKRKSISLPAGTVGYRRDSVRLVIDNEPVVMAWAKRSCPQAVTTVEWLAKAEINQHFEQTGEVPDAGAHLEPERERFFVK